jgi:hypothetical protein
MSKLTAGKLTTEMCLCRFPEKKLMTGKYISGHNKEILASNDK